ncbi:unnamed protein product [Nippostrongylus brasiliensis]|uniref:FAD-dependent oxidoreductase n=1 Tax=Nippostrongylus brasiliensis TaxID=27835 RepID=A0A0N4XH61_NIPBR|nr:unnamed protein product [Nippostrongylus brasiliensis]
MSAKTSLAVAISSRYFGDTGMFLAPRSSSVYDVIIVGAGLTGLSAARELKALQPNARVKILEAKDEVGGRIRAAAMKTAEGEAPMDMGEFP